MAPVIDREFVRLQKGQSVKITVTTFPGRVFQGRISVITPALDLQSRTAEIHITISNPGYLLHPGMFGKTEIVLQSNPKAILVPIQTLIRQEDKDFVSFSTGGMVSSLISFGNETPIDVEILGYDFAAASRAAEEVAGLVRSTAGTKDVRISREQDYPRQNIVVDRERVALLGLNVAQVAKCIQTFVNGYPASFFSDSQTGNRYDITVRAQETDRGSIGDLSQICVFNAQGRPITLDNIATISSAAGPIQIQRKYQQRIIHVTANTYGRDLGIVAADLQAKLDQLSLPSGLKINLGGAIESQRESSAYFGHFFSPKPTYR